MTGFEFSLDRVLTIKRLLERRAEAEQARAGHVLGVAEARAADARAAEATEAGRTDGAATPHEWSARSVRTDHLTRVTARADEAVARAAEAYAAAAAERTVRATETETLDVLKNQRWEEWRQEVLAADQDRLDEIGVRRWAANRDDSR